VKLGLTAALVVFGALVLLLGRSEGPVGEPVAAVGGISPRGGADRLERLQRPGASLTALGHAYLERARTTGDPAFYSRAERAFDGALRRDARDIDALVGAGTLANLRHDFSAGLRLGRAARRIAPELARPLTVIGDAQVELGRHRAAARTIQRLAGLKPGLASYARVSYFRELSGDQAGAVAAMRLAASSGADPYVQTLVGDLELGRGRVEAARRAYLEAPRGYPQALAGLARVDAARGAFGRAAARLRRSTERLPLTSTLALLAEVEEAAGMRRRATADLDAARAQHRLQRASGTAPDAEAVLFEAAHGDPDAAVGLGRRVWEAAPGIRSADALGWALTRAGRPREGLRYARRALALGSRDPLFRLHVGLAALALDHYDLARRHLAIAAAGRAALSPLDAQRLDEAL
jgi:tetratricopeptide (TPR) repeat protein